MKRFKDVEHLVRLAALFAAGILVFSIARAELVPATFGTLVLLRILPPWEPVWPAEPDGVRRVHA